MTHYTTFNEPFYPALSLVLLAPPGSGKGTQAEQLKRDLNLQHIATGDIFRDHLKRETTLGLLAKSYMNKGLLVPDEVTEGMVRERLSSFDIGSGFILDGFPRTLSQGEALTDMLTDIRLSPLDAVIHLNVSDETIVNRLSGRFICRDCQSPYHQFFNPPRQEGVCDYCASNDLYRRQDDRPETVFSRLKTYEQLTTPLIDYYARAGLLYEINGEGPVFEVTARIMATLGQIQTLPLQVAY